MALELDHTHRQPESPCPFCGYTLDASSGGSGPGPKEGDISLCAKCGRFLIFTEVLALREPSLEELEEIARNPDCIHLLRAWQMMKAQQQ